MIKVLLVNGAEVLVGKATQARFVWAEPPTIIVLRLKESDYTSDSLAEFPADKVLGFIVEEEPAQQ